MDSSAGAGLEGCFVTDEFETNAFSFCKLAVVAAGSSVSRVAVGFWFCVDSSFVSRAVAIGDVWLLARRR